MHHGDQLTKTSRGSDRHRAIPTIAKHCLTLLRNLVSLLYSTSGKKLINARANNRSPTIFTAIRYRALTDYLRIAIKQRPPILMSATTASPGNHLLRRGNRDMCIKENYFTLSLATLALPFPTETGHASPAKLSNSGRSLFDSSERTRGARSV